MMDAIYLKLSRKLLWNILCLFCANALLAQGDWRASIRDEWFQEYGSKRLQIGDTLPDGLIGPIINNHNGVKKFSDFRGKLLILDFWSTYCTSCIAKFPEMEALQKEFGEEIQIVLVNSFETLEAIKDRQKVISFNIPNLPCIIAEANDFEATKNWLNKLFPTRGVPHHVWIDQLGVVRLMGGPLNTYSEKIRDFLNKKQVFNLNDLSMVPNIDYDSSITYSSLIGKFKATSIQYQSLFTNYNNEVDGNSKEVVDSIRGTRTNYYINQDILNTIVFDVFKEKYLHQFQRLVYGPRMDWTECLILPETLDTLAFTNYFARTRKGVKLKDYEFIQSLFCYEQIVPLELGKSKRLSYLLEDINRYCKQKYGITCAIETRRTPVYNLVSISSDKPIISSISNKNMSEIDSDISLEVFKIIQGNASIKNEILRNKIMGDAFLIYNKIYKRATKKLDLQNKAYNSIEDLNDALKKSGMMLTKEIVELKYIVFSKEN